jgi:hypothetical protein
MTGLLIRLRKKLKNWRSNLLSIWRRANGNTLPVNLQQASHIQQLYHSILLSDFINQVEAGTYNVEVYNRFFEDIRDKQGRYIAKLVKEITILETKYNIIALSVTYFSALKQLGGSELDKDIFAIVSQHINIRPTDSIEVILSRSTKFITDLEIKKQELERIKPTEGVKVDRSYFTHLVIAVSKHMKCFIDKKQITVAEFAEMINDLRLEVEEVEKMNKRQTGKR